MSLGPNVRGKRHGGSPRNKGGRVGCIRRRRKAGRESRKTNKDDDEGASWTRKKMERELEGVEVKTHGGVRWPESYVATSRQPLSTE